MPLAINTAVSVQPLGVECDGAEWVAEDVANQDRAKLSAHLVTFATVLGGLESSDCARYGAESAWSKIAGTDGCGN